MPPQITGVKKVYQDEIIQSSPNGYGNAIFQTVLVTYQNDKRG